MHKTSFLIKKTVGLLLLSLAITSNINAQNRSNLSYVNPFIGTTKSGVLTHWGGDGGTYPGAVAPSGFIQISPETRTTGARGYNYADSSIYYFSCFGHHSGFPEGSSGRLFIMPVAAGQVFEPGINKNRFSHQNEIARTGYYRVKFTDNNIVTEASTSIRTGILRFVFPAKTKAQVYIGNAGDITIVSGKVIHGSALNTVINFSEAFTGKKNVKDGYLFTFKTASTAKVIELKLSTSTVSFTGAQSNIDKEIAKLNFNAFVARTGNDWAKQLSAVDITDNSEANKAVFYTALYHSLLIPWVISDVDGNYRGEDGIVYHTLGKYQYGGFSPWDTFRSLHPLLSLLYPEKQNDIILSMLDIYKQTGHLPTESMTGNHAIPIIVDAYLKGITGFDKGLAYKAMKSNIVDSPFVQKDMNIYHRMGYVPYTNSESVTRTVEYAYDDWALSQYAKQVMHNDADYQLLQQRGFNYRNLFHPNDLFMLPRSGNDFKLNPGMSGYKEGDKWVYSYFVPHNAKDLVNLMGGNNAFANRLDSALRNDVILFDNETVIHVPYLFNAAGRPDLTQAWCRNIMLSRYKNQPDGLPGNDDLGAMSSAYVFNSLGIFPLSPGKPEYAIGAPLFQLVTLHLANHKTWIIQAKNQSAENKYVSSLIVNGKDYEQLVLPHSTIAGGGMMQFTMINNAHHNNWPVDKNPVSLSETKTPSDIRVTNYSLQKNKVESNEQLWLRFTAQNKGSTGTKDIRIYADGKVVTSRNYLIPQGSTITDSISCRLYRLGKVRVGLDSAGNNTVEVTDPVQPVLHPFEISGFTSKPLIRRGWEQQINYTVKNLTGKDQLFAIPVKLNDSILYTDHVQLSPGESKALSHSFKDKVNGVKYLIVNDIKSVYKVFSDSVGSLLLNLSLTTNDSDQLIADKSGFGNDGYIIRSITVENGKRILLGDHCFVEVSNAPSLDNLQQTITMMSWIYPEGKETGLVDMLTKGDTHVLQMNDNKALTFFAGGWGRGDCTVNLPANWKQNWHHIAGVCNGNVLSVYIDGQLVGTSKVEGLVNLSVANKWQIGRNEEFPSERIFHGYMDGIKVYAQPLSAVEIQDVFNKEQSNYKNQPGK